MNNALFPDLSYEEICNQSPSKPVYDHVSTAKGNVDYYATGDPKSQPSKAVYDHVSMVNTTISDSNEFGFKSVEPVYKIHNSEA